MRDFKHLRVGVVGGGRVGAALGRALQNAGYVIDSVAGSSPESKARIKKLLPRTPILLPKEVAKRADLLILAVPDDKLETVIESLRQQLRSNQFVLHTSGSKGLAVFEGVPCRGIALHPAMTFTGSRYDVRRLVGATYGVTVRDQSKRRVETQLAHALVQDLNGTVIMLNEDQRVLYHAALSHSSNYLVTLVSQAFEMLEQAGVEDAAEVLEPLLTAALGNVLFKQGEALSGPISRGDVRVIEQHRRVLAETLPALLPTYDAMGEATVELARQTGRISDEQEQKLRDALD